MPDQRIHEPETGARFEPQDVPPFLPLWLAGGLAFFIVAVLVGITISFPLADQQQFRGPLKTLPPSPRLQLAPGMDLRRYEQAKQQELQERGEPIEAAMNATAEQGWGPPR